MTIVALCIEPGSVESDFPRGLADHLGLRLCDLRRFEYDIAERSDFGDGRLRSHGSRHGGTLAAWDLKGEQLAARIREVVLEHVIDGDALIVGWSAASIVRGFDHIARVMVRAPLRFRQFTAMRQLAYRELGTAELEIDSADSLIDRFVQRLFACDWRDPANYDIVMDADRLPERLQINLFKALIKNERFLGAPGGRAQVEAALDMMRMHEDWSADISAGKGGAAPARPGANRPPGRYLQ